MLSPNAMARISTGCVASTVPVRVFLACWSWLYGAVAMEVFGQLRWALTDASALFESELVRLGRLLAPA